MTYAWALAIAAISVPVALGACVTLVVKSWMHSLEWRKRTAEAAAQVRKDKLDKLTEELEQVRSRVNSIYASKR